MPLASVAALAATAAAGSKAGGEVVSACWSTPESGTLRVDGAKLPDERKDGKVGCAGRIATEKRSGCQRLIERRESQLAALGELAAYVEERIEAIASAC